MQIVGTQFFEKNMLEKPKLRLGFVNSLYFWYETLL